MIERRFLIPEEADIIFDIENSSSFYLIGDFDNGKIYHDILSGNHDLYYVDHDLMDEKECERYNELCNVEESDMP